MILKNKVVFVYDIEIFPNVFHCISKNTETKEYHYFEVSCRKNNISELIDFFSNTKDKIICGYNNIHYDNPIINFILDYKNTCIRYNYIRLCRNLFNLSNIIITSKDNNEFDKWKKWKYAKNFETLDLLTLMFSQALRVGLKEMQVTMRYKNVKEFDGNFNDELQEKDIDEMIYYNKNDVDSTECLLYLQREAIELRLDIEKEFGVNVLNCDGMTIGMEIIKNKYLEKTGKTWMDIKDLRSPCDMIPLNEVILPFIKYDTPVLQKLLSEMKTKVVSPGRKGYEKHFILQNMEVSVGVGGIHSKNNPEKIIPREDEMLLDSDVNSLYPSLIVSYNFIPPHLGLEFLEVYANIREERLIAKRNGDKVKNETLKLALNGLSGNLQNEYSWVYSPKTVMQIRMNGQMLLLMLAEKLIAIGCRLIQINTDGILYIVKKDKYEELQSVLKEWETITKLSLETDEFEAFYQYAINDYIGVSKGYSETKNPKLLKKKGLFIDKVSLGKGMNALIIPKAINNYFVNHVPIKETIYNSKDINDFITYQKVSKEFNVEYNGSIIQRINRYYASTNGPYLYRCRIIDGVKTDYAILLSASGITIVNNINDIKQFPDNINYDYYIGEANKIVSAIENTQLSLMFN